MNCMHNVCRGFMLLSIKEKNEDGSSYRKGIQFIIIGQQKSLYFVTFASKNDVVLTFLTRIKFEIFHILKEKTHMQEGA